MNTSPFQSSTAASSASLTSKLFRFLHHSSQPEEVSSDNASILSDDSFHLLSISSSISTSPCSTVELAIFNKFASKSIFSEFTQSDPDYELLSDTENEPQQFDTENDLQSAFTPLLDAANSYFPEPANENVVELALTPFEPPLSSTPLVQEALSPTSPILENHPFVPPAPLELPNIDQEDDVVENATFSLKTMFLRFKETVNKSMHHSHAPISLKVPLVDSATSYNSNQENLTLPKNLGENRSQKIKFNKMADMLVYNKAKHSASPFSSPSPTSPYEYPDGLTDSSQSSPRLSRSSSLTRKLSTSFRRNRSHNNFRTLEKPNSILKSKINQNFNSEVFKVSEIDKMNLSEFLNNFRNDEISKLHQEHQLSEYRLNQLKNYYDNEFMPANDFYNTYC